MVLARVDGWWVLVIAAGLALGSLDQKAKLRTLEAEAASQRKPSAGKKAAK